MAQQPNQLPPIKNPEKLTPITATQVVTYRWEKGYDESCLPLVVCTMSDVEISSTGITPVKITNEGLTLLCQH